MLYVICHPGHRWTQASQSLRIRNWAQEKKAHLFLWLELLYVNLKAEKLVCLSLPLQRKAEMTERELCGSVASWFWFPVSWVLLRAETALLSCVFFPPNLKRKVLPYYLVNSHYPKLPPSAPSCSLLSAQSFPVIDLGTLLFLWEEMTAYWSRENASYPLGMNWIISFVAISTTINQRKWFQPRAAHTLVWGFSPGRPRWQLSFPYISHSRKKRSPGRIPHVISWDAQYLQNTVFVILALVRVSIFWK